MSSCPDVVAGWHLWVPPPEDRKKRWINLNDRNHWGKKSPLTKYWREETRDRVLELVCEEWTDLTWTAPHVTAFLAFGDNRRRDVHNYMPTIKAVIDGCTDAGLWEDDRDGILTGPDLRRDESRPVGVTLWIREHAEEWQWG